MRCTQNVFSYYRMCSLTLECVLSQASGSGQQQAARALCRHGFRTPPSFAARLKVECVLLQQSVLSDDRMCSLTIECVLLP